MDGRQKSFGDDVVHDMALQAIGTGRSIGRSGGDLMAKPIAWALKGLGIWSEGKVPNFHELSKPLVNKVLQTPVHHDRSLGPYAAGRGSPAAVFDSTYGNTTNARGEMIPTVKGTNIKLGKNLRLSKWILVSVDTVIKIWSTPNPL